MTEQRKKRGRPRKPEGQARTVNLPSPSATPDEDFKIRALAEQAKMPVATYIRHAALNAEIKAPAHAIDAKVLHELNRCGVNLHQIVRGMNFGHAIPSDIADVLDELKTAIGKVAEAYDP